jgi:hypothetical protein
MCYNQGNGSEYLDSTVDIYNDCFIYTISNIWSERGELSRVRNKVWDMDFEVALENTGLISRGGVDDVIGTCRRRSYTLTLGGQFRVVRAPFTETHVPASGLDKETSRDPNSFRNLIFLSVKLFY